MSEWRDDLIPYDVMDFLQRKFWPAVETPLFGVSVLLLAVACWAAVGYVLIVWTMGQP